MNKGIVGLITSAVSSAVRVLCALWSYSLTVGKKNLHRQSLQKVCNLYKALRNVTLNEANNRYLHLVHVYFAVIYRCVMATDPKSIDILIY